jgi:hypothetical protein
MRRIAGLANALAAAATMMVAAPAGAALSIPLTVQEPGAGARTAEPVTSGVPLPPGTQTSDWALFDGNREIPLQITPLRGRVPWILLDFQLDIGSGQTKKLLLKEQAPQPAGPNLAPTAPPTRRTVVLAGSDKVIEGVPERETWEYRGPLRAVLRVDGRFDGIPGFGFTTRYTFYAGKKYVRVEHVLRNSLQANQRQLKLTSAILSLGTGESRTRAPYMGSISDAGGGGVTFEMLPTQQPGVHDPKKRQNVSMADNGGYLLPDLTHYGATVIWDPGKEARAPVSPLFALADPSWYGEWGELSTSKFGSLEDERETYRRLGWKWSAKQEPHYPNQPEYLVTINRVSVHYDSESDDLWGNLMMYLRSGIRGYLDRTRGWANYYKWEMAFRTDGFKYAWDGNAERPHVARPPVEIELTPWDRAYLRQVMDGKVDTHTWAGDHVWGWGLLDYYALTGDVDALEAAGDIGESVETLWLWRTEYNPIYGTRNVARNLLLAVRLYDATGDTRWKVLADHIVDLALKTPFWRESWGMYAWPRKDGGYAVSPHHLAEYHHALWRYDARIGNAEVRRRLVKMSTFVRDHALHPKWLHSAKSIHLDPDGPGTLTFMSWTDAEEPKKVNPYHTIVWVDTLVRGYRLTGDPSFLQRAIVFWDRGSKGQYLKPATHRVAGDREVGRFANARFNCCGQHPIFFYLNGDLQFVHLLFYDAARAKSSLARAADSAPRLFVPPAGRVRTVAFQTPDTKESSPPHLRGLGANQWVQVTPPERTVYQSVLTTSKDTTDCGRTMTDGDPVFRSFSGLAASPGVVFYFGGGHAGHPGNDVDLYSTGANRWEIPYPAECPEPGTPVARQVKGGATATRGITPNGRPWVHHSYQNSRYDPPRKRFIFVGGEGTWAFDLAKRDWTHLVARDKGLGPTWGSTGGLVHDPKHDRMVAFASSTANGSPRGIYHLDLKAHRWSYAAAFPSADGYSFINKIVTAATIPQRREAIVMTTPVVPHADGPKLWRYHLDRGAWDEVKSFGTRETSGAPAAAIPTTGANWDYDSRNNRVVFLATPREVKDGGERSTHVWSWDPDADRWTQHPPAEPRPTQQGRSRYSFVYDERHNVFVYVEVRSLYCGVAAAACGGPTNTWLYRLAGETPASGAPRTTASPRPTLAAAVHSR